MGSLEIGLLSSVVIKFLHWGIKENITEHGSQINDTKHAMKFSNKSAFSCLSNEQQING